MKIARLAAAHIGNCCRCFLPDLTGFTILCCTGPGYQSGEKWRREGDSNPRYTFVGIHTISSRAPSASRTSLHISILIFIAGLSISRILLWRREGDSNPRESFLAPKSISSRSRYDHFGTSPQLFCHSQTGDDAILFSRKKPLKISPQAPLRTPSVIATRWLSLLSSRRR